MLAKNRVLLLVCCSALLCCATRSVAQERPRTVRQPSAAAPDAGGEVLRVNTRAVFIDALVRDERTNEPVRDLKPEDFQVLGDGRPRKLSYFTREGDSRRPLAMLLFVDLWTQYGRSHLKSADAMRRLAGALTKLAPEDEAAVVVTWIEEGDPPGTLAPTIRMLGGFTRDRAQTAAALTGIPELVRRQERLVEEIAERRAQSSDDMLLDVVWRLSDVAGQVVPLASNFPNSQFVVVGLISDLFALRKGEREAAARRRSGPASASTAWSLKRV